MSFFRRFSLLLAAPMSLLTSCVPDGPAASSPAPSTTFPVSRDINTLGKSIALPRRPLGAVWQMKQMGDGEMGPSDYSITAVMQFSPRDLKWIVDSASSRGSHRVVQVPLASWYPAPLQKKAVRNNSGKLRLSVQNLSAFDFEKLSLRNGNLFHVVGTNYCVLSLSTT